MSTLKKKGESLNMSEIKIKEPSSKPYQSKQSGNFKMGNILLQKYDEFIQKKSQCIQCQKKTRSINRKVPGELTWMWCAIASVASLCLLPFFLQSCSNVQIYCAECLVLKDEKKNNCCQC